MSCVVFYFSVYVSVYSWHQFVRIVMNIRLLLMLVMLGLPVAVVTGLLVGVLLGVAMLAVVIACLKRSVIVYTHSLIFVVEYCVVDTAKTRRRQIIWLGLGLRSYIARLQ